MKILLSDAGKRYSREWIFRHLHYEFNAGTAYAITGNNGSGKSTLLQVIAGAVQHNEGNITFSYNNHTIASHEHYRHVTIAAPYLELPEEMTLVEYLQFHQSFKPMISAVTQDELITTVGLANAKHKQIRNFSSGMKQRIKLAQAIFSNVPVVLLDEPCSNLDAEGIALYHHLIQTYCTNRLLIISSNDEEEIHFCNHRLSILDYK
jgi:ABC-type multidrug transport system ATPase subunit